MGLIVEKLRDYEKDNSDGGEDDGLEKLAISFINENLVVWLRLLIFPERQR